LSTEELTVRAQTAVRDGRSAAIRYAQVLMKGRTAFAGGVLIGMSGALRPQLASPTAVPAKARKQG